MGNTIGLTRLKFCKGASFESGKAKTGVPILGREGSHKKGLFYIKHKSYFWSYWRLDRGLSYK
uniref:Uncharacterized protein n=1 Tax=Lepeophtheirus salmonis TaxID=72036 RepID=A0A0K2UD41_LEPSM